MNLIELFLAFWGSLLPSILFNVRPDRLFWVGVSGLLGWFVFAHFQDAARWPLLPILSGAFTVGIYSEVMARVLKSPATIFSVAGVFPLVPGIAAYTTIKNLVENNLPDAARSGIETLSSAGAIALGIMIASSVFQLHKKIRNFYRI
jgi:uncharacterized membrane protein YjjB (DUF3815 family)